ncbi:phage portal protein [Paractinoplanes rishiriensis]|uniref:Chromosome partitioning protein ParA n=1 Tax=Paractinoplanes rishiriensis TaxID=1050105 RepID=A0A919N2W2_9ACTN|nr:phage portal protein [Actinoplanes rishiriensis]GIF02218.1 chromosome partitioning protein ParA [Actinoplanes rishiriensis]
MQATLASARQLLNILDRDLPRLQRIDAYVQGRHDGPYMPPQADDEYRLLAKRAISNWMPLLVGTPAQALYVDSFRRGSTATTQPADQPLPEWRHWQNSRLDARQTSIHRGALAYGHAFTLTEKTARGVRTKGLSPLRTAALYEDPANDDTPYVALTVTRKPADDLPGLARMWDGSTEYRVAFVSYRDADKVTVAQVGRHGATECPVTRFAAAVDLEGRTVGVVEPMIPLQNRINQSVFDLLVAQTYGSFKVRWATGMAPPLLMEPVHAAENDPTSEVVDWRPKLGPDGRPIPAPININAKRFLFAEDPEVKFGTLDETPLAGFIASIDMSIRHLSAVSQTPPHHLLGQIANLSAEALLAAETALSRKIEEFRRMFGEAWERVFRLAAELDGNTSSAQDLAGEVIWRDMELKSLAQSADGLGKLAESLGIPKRGLWSRVPGVTRTELDEWERLREEDDAELQLAQALNRATPDPASLPVAA